MYNNIGDEFVKNKYEEIEEIRIKDEGVEFLSNDDCFVFNENDDLLITIMNKANKDLSKIKEILNKMPSFINVVKSIIPNDSYQAVLSVEQKLRLANGTYELMTKKNGSLIANIINPKTKKIISQVPIEKIKMTPELSNTLIDYSTQLQLAQIANDIKCVQIAVEEVIKGQENDRLALAYSSKQKLLQAISIKDENLKKMALLNLVSSAEDARNTLMLSQSNNVDFIKKQPKDTFGKLINGASDKKVDNKINEIRENLNALNLVSLVETLAYQELGEGESAKISIKYYGDFIKKTYLLDEYLIDRLDSLESKNQYWSNTLPNIIKKIDLLVSNSRVKELEVKRNDI